MTSTPGQGTAAVCVRCGEPLVPVLLVREPRTPPEGVPLSADPPVTAACPGCARPAVPD
jgi:hypothetical protein